MACTIANQVGKQKRAKQEQKDHVGCEEKVNLEFPVLELNQSDFPPAGMHKRQQIVIAQPTWTR